jgi:chemosensory pili system protein ChpA (sensor histidine kinase/response regulator)
MSELDAFVSLCESIQSHAAHLATAQIQPFAQLALEAWRRSHALVAIGQKTQLPSQLTLPETWNLLGEATLEAQDPVLGEATLEEHRSPVEPFMDSLDLFPDSPPSLGDLESNLFDFDTLSDLDLAEIAAMEDLQGVIGDFNFEEAAQDAKSLIPEPSLEETWNCDATEIAEGGSQTITAGESQTIASETAEEIWINDQPETDKTDSVAEPSVQDSDPVFDPLTSIPAPTLSPKETAGTTVRVPMEQLQKINALFGQLIVERNAINLRLSQLQNFVTLMTQRMNQLERSNHQLRQWYDQSAVMEIRNFSFGDATRTEFGIRKQEQGIWQEEVQGSIGQGEQLSPQMIQISRQQAANTALASIPNSELRTPNSELRTPNSFQFDTLELDRYTDLHVLSQDQMETIVQLQEVAADIGLSLREMEEATGDLNYTTRSLQSSITRTQMRPFSDIVSRFPRVVRDLSLQYNKQVQLKLEGETTLIDRLTLENLTDPLNHLLRNAFAHGIEDLETRQALGKPPLGTITLRATHRGNQTIITMQDDGQGISLDKIRDRLGKLGMAQTEIESLRDRELLDLIFEPGFSTAEQLTELSGRGVGMDVVRTNLQQIRGDIRIDTKPNQGTTFTLRVP